MGHQRRHAAVTSLSLNLSLNVEESRPSNNHPAMQASILEIFDPLTELIMSELRILELDHERKS